MSLTKTTKQSYETYMIYGDFSAVIDAEETILTHTVTALKDDGVTDATDIVINAGDTVVGAGNDYANLYVRVKDGVQADSPYKITMKIDTSNGNQWEVDGLLVIKEL